MEIELNRFTPAEQATFRLRALYEQAGYRKYRASRFEEYALYQAASRLWPRRPAWAAIIARPAS